ncbi:MAG: amino acid adenylation domain-containing protein, partial [Nostocales cyanobacterium]
LEFLGRIDQQIKLRGFRIELGEIEGVLLQHPLVKEAVVILDKNDHNSRLLAYVTHIATSVDISFELQEYLKNCLPHYMIPSQIMVLEQLPLTANGKINKQKLPLPNIDISEHLQIPVTPTEEILANLWQELLKIENIKSVSREHNFFELGGNSLLATQLITRIRDSFGIELSVRKIFEHSILSELAKAVEIATKTITLPPLLPQAENEAKHLSFAQSRLWFIAQLENQGSSSTYNMPAAFHIEGNLNIAALQQSLTYLLQRHSSLRTYFPPLQGEPQIVIRNIEEIEVLEITDLHKLDLQTQSETIQKLADTHAQKPFNLNTDCLFRAKLLQVNKNENILLINMHHIISDGWSMGIFKREWEQVYNAYAAGMTPNLFPLPIQYSDFAVWQRQWLQGEVLETQEKYWKNQLKDAPKLLELPTDYPRPAQQSYQGKHEEYYLSKELTQQLKKLSQEQGVTLFMTLLTAFNILLSRYSRQEDLCVGSGIANRTHQDTENLIGFFVNTLVLRSKINSEKTFIDLLQQTRKTCLDAYAHQDIPFEYLVEKLQPERSLSCNPLCQVMIVLQNMEGVGKKINLTDLNIQQLSPNYPFAKFDLTLYLFDSDEQLYCMWEYATDLFTMETIKRITRHFEVLLTAILQNPQQPIYQLPLITPTEIQKLKTWNQTDINYSEKQTLINLFNKQVQTTPNHFAVFFQSQTLTYQELDHKANQLANYLINNYAIQADTLIGICVERSLEMIIGLLGILKTGAAYVPLDPEYPLERLRFMVEDANVTLIITQKQFTDKFTNDENRLICLDEIADKILNNSPIQPNINISENHLANVIYTSGSTGKPKGVMVEHRGIYNLVKSQIQTFGVNSHSRILQFASFSFDAASSEIFMALGTGATLYLATKNSLIPGKPLIGQLNKYKITHITLPPSALAVIPETTLPSLQTIIVAGETCALELMQKWSVDRNFFNAYGPTEASVCTSIYQCNNHYKKIAIGKPINNNRVYILDANNKILPPGIPGELCIAGVGLARGYLNQPELTSEKFIEIELELLGKHERIYKTGDLAKWDNQGNLYYLGRLDHQVKLRGFRIELSEIEATLIKHQKIKEAVVVLRKDSDFDQLLVAYIVPNLTAKNTNTDEFIKLWSDLFNNNYSQQINPTDDPTLNIAGWNDSYTGKPISSDAMQEWRDTTVERILALSPQKVWEIGCGSGMLLFKIAPHSQHYLGTDFSTGALKYIEQYLEPQSLDNKVTLKQSQANDFTNIQNNNYDVVILNSVIQYFPSVDYLINVLAGVINSVSHQGKIFIGDVRNLHLLEVFHTATEFYRSPENFSIPELLENIKRSIITEEELLIDPDFFIAIKQKFPRITHVEIQLKRSYHHTEMSRFRYDVILYLDQLEVNFTQTECLDWRDQQLNLESIQEILTTKSPDLLHIKNIPNARLSIEIALLENIGELEGNVKDLQRYIETLNHRISSGIEPENFHDLTANLPYKVFLQYNSTNLGNYDVILQKNISQQQQIPRFNYGCNYQDNYDCKPWQDYANQPLKYQTNNINIDPSLLTEWRDFLNKTLPNYMIPSHFVVLEKLPLTPNGKIDRKALPAPNAIITKNNIELPVTKTEKFLAQIWVKLLKYEAISRQDNFFNLGGHSLLATQLCYLIRDQFKVDIPLSKIFDLPILCDLAKYIDSCIWVNYNTLEIEPLSADEEEIEF